MNESLRLTIDRVDTLVGKMLIVADHKENLRAVDWADHEARMRRLLRLHFGDNGFELEPVRNPNDLTGRSADTFGESLPRETVYQYKQLGQRFSERCGMRCEASPAARPFLM
jgi:methylated-DNA-[protein]-cysteine S-methyltransferase